MSGVKAGASKRCSAQLTEQPSRACASVRTTREGTRQRRRRRSVRCISCSPATCRRSETSASHVQSSSVSFVSASMLPPRRQYPDPASPIHSPRPRPPPIAVDWTVNAFHSRLLDDDLAGDGVAVRYPTSLPPPPRTPTPPPPPTALEIAFESIRDKPVLQIACAVFVVWAIAAMVCRRRPEARLTLQGDSRVVSALVFVVSILGLSMYLLTALREIRVPTPPPSPRY